MLTNENLDEVQINDSNLNLNNSMILNMLIHVDRYEDDFQLDQDYLKFERNIF